MEITTDFDGANIECVSCSQADNIRLRIRPDNNSEHLQWFYFRLTGAKDRDCRLIIENGDQVSYRDGFHGYRTVVSNDNSNWHRIDTSFDGKNLTIAYRPESDSVYFAYFAPFSWEQHRRLIDKALQSSAVTYHRLGATVDGRSIELLQIGHVDKNKKKAWIIARQHPGETMAEWWMQGFLEKLLDANDPVARQALAKYTFYIVPNMNPDGSVRGHLRTNAVGKNLNREWLEPTADQSPEVYYVRAKMEGTGVDFCLDVHGDEALPYNFIAGAQGIPSWNDQKQDQLDSFQNYLASINADFQTEKGYPVNAPGKANMTMCTAYIAEHFDCLAMTLEMPFKDTIESPIPETGWSPARCKKLAHSCLDAILHIAPKL